MLVSGGKVIAIDSIKKGNTNKDTLSGDGVWTNLGVNTDVIATTKKLEDTKSELESKINSASSALSGEIKKKQDELKFELNQYDKITAIGPKNGTTTALAGGSNVVVSAGANTRVDSATSGEQTIYTVNVTANPTNVTVSGEHGLSARRDNNTSAYYLGLYGNYEQEIKNVSSKLPKSTFDSYTATADAIAYSAANNYIKITAHKISGYDWTNTITAASAKAVTTVDNKFEGNGNSYSGYNGKPFIDNTTPKWSVVGDGNRISVTSANNKYGVSWDGRGIATEQWVEDKDYLPKTEAAETYLTIVSANEIYQKKLRAGAGIVIKNETDISVDISVSGDIIPYSAGEGIGIDNHIVSITADYLSANALKDLSGRWESASNALEASADNWNKTYKDVSDSAKYWNTTYERVELSGDEWDKVTDKLDSATFKTYSALMEQKLIDLDDKNLDTSAFTAWSAQTTDWDISAYSAGKGIGIDKHVISITADYLSANALDKIKETSGKWDSTYSSVYDNSAKWETAYETLTSNSADWDEVSAKLNSATFATYSADIKTTIETFSGEFVELSGNFTTHSADSNLHLNEGEREKWNSAANRVENSAAIWDTVSAKVNKTEFEDFKTSAHNELEKKLDKNAFESWSANKDYDFYSAGNGIKIENHIVSVSADYALSADVDTRLTNYYDKDKVDELIANFGGYTTATSAEPDGHPDVDKIDPRRIYLVKMGSGPTSADNYKEWIYIDTASAWNCVGETTMDLTPYLTKEDAARTYQPIGDYVVSSTDVIKPGSAWVLVNDDNNIQWSGLDVSELGKKYIVKSTNGSVKVGSATVGNVVTYDLSADNMPTISSEYMLSNYNSATNKYELSGAKIVGENGVSAKYNPATNEWNVGLENNNLVAYGRYTTNQTSYTTSAAITNFVQEDSIGNDIYLNNGEIYLNSGFYHVDLQVNVNVPGNDNNYYTATVKSTTAPLRQMIQDIDASYSHSEMLDLSYDIRITSDDTLLEFTIENLPTGATYNVHNLDIHRIIYSISEIEGATTYIAGKGILIDQNDNNSINVNAGKGLTINNGDNTLQVKLGEGLTFSTSGDINAIVINKEVEEVVETVEKLSEDLDTKVTTNMAIADIATVHQGSDYFNSISFGNNHGQDSCGMLNQLFSIPINNKLYVDDGVTEHVTHFGIYTDHSFNSNYGVIFSLFEYNFDGNNGAGDTEWLCDTGAVKWNAGGRNEFPIIHMRENAELRADRMYYASVCIDGTDVNNLYLAGTSTGYAPTVNSTPKLTFGVSNLGLSLDNPNESTSGLHGFSYDESCHGNPRFFIQIRNKKVRG